MNKEEYLNFRLEKIEKKLYELESKFNHREIINFIVEDINYGGRLSYLIEDMVKRIIDEKKK